MLLSKFIVYVTIFILTLFLSGIASHVNDYFQYYKQEEEVAMINKYLLKDTNNPKLWIHTTYDKDIWESLSHDNVNDVSYLFLTVRSIVKYCKDDFTICLINDESFSKLIPSWNVNMNILPEPMKSNLRQYGLTYLLYLHGGMLVPNHFLCLKSLKHMFERSSEQNTPFVCEIKNNLSDICFLGCLLKKDETILRMSEYLKSNINNFQYSSSNLFLHDTSRWCFEQIALHQMTLVGGEVIGVTSLDHKPIRLEDLMEEQSIQLHIECCGIYIPKDEMSKRLHYNWFTLLSSQEIVKTSTILGKYIKKTME